MSDRFTPVSAPTQAAGEGTSTGSRFTAVPMGSTGATVQPQIGIGPDLGQQIQQGIGMAQQGTGALNQANSLGGNFLGSLSPYTGMLGSALSLGGGLAGIANAANNDNLGGALSKTQGVLGTAAGIGGSNSIYSGLLGGQTLADSTSNALGQLFGGGAGNAAANAALGADIGAAGSGAAIMGGISSIPMIWEMLNDNHLFGLLGPDPMQETRDIRNAFHPAWDAYQNAPETLAKVGAAAPTDIAALTGLLQNANYQQAQGPAVSQYISTLGGMKQGVAGPSDLSQITPYSGRNAMDATLANTAALEKLAQAGQDVSTDSLMNPNGPYNVSDFWSNPDSQIRALWDYSGAEQAWDPAARQAASDMLVGVRPDQVNRLAYGGAIQTTAPDQFQSFYTQTPGGWTLSDEQRASLADPAHRLEAIQTLFTGLNPNFATSDLGKAITGLLQPAGATTQPTATSGTPRFTAASPTQPAVGATQPATSGSRFTAV